MLYPVIIFDSVIGKQHVTQLLQQVRVHISNRFLSHARTKAFAYYQKWLMQKSVAESGRNTQYYKI